MCVERGNTSDLSLPCIYTYTHIHIYIYVLVYVERENTIKRFVAPKVPAILALQYACQRMSLYIYPQPSEQ